LFWLSGCEAGRVDLGAVKKPMEGRLRGDAGFVY
jgi:hypothetical protein